MRVKLTAAGIALVVGVTGAQAQELRYAHGYPATNPSAQGPEVFKAYVEENSDLKVTIYGQSLLSLTETPAGLRDGIADMGAVLTPYSVTDFPNPNLVSNMSMYVTSGEQISAPGAAMAGATMEYIFLNCEECQAEYTNQNMVYLGSSSTAPFDLLCSSPVADLDQIRGKTYRSAADNFGRWAEAFGGVRVSIPSSEVFEAMSQGVVDCAMMSASDLTGLSLFEVVTHVTPSIPGGIFSGTDLANINRDAWARLSDEQKAVVLQGANQAIASTTAEYYHAAAKNLEDAPAQGVEVLAPSDEMAAAYSDHVTNDMGVILSQFSNDYGVSDVEAKMETIRNLIDKWKGLTADWDGEDETLADLYWENIYSKVDLATYGAN